jgi:hypothetical protein
MVRQKEGEKRPAASQQVPPYVSPFPEKAYLSPKTRA